MCTVFSPSSLSFRLVLRYTFYVFFFDCLSVRENTHGVGPLNNYNRCSMGTLDTVEIEIDLLMGGYFGGKSLLVQSYFVFF